MPEPNLVAGWLNRLAADQREVAERRWPFIRMERRPQPQAFPLQGASRYSLANRAMTDMQKEICTLMLASSCFGGEVCPFPPCACARSLIEAVAENIAKFLETETGDKNEALARANAVRAYARGSH